jgi:hypothetical protein
MRKCSGMSPEDISSPGGRGAPTGIPDGPYLDVVGLRAPNSVSWGLLPSGNVDFRRSNRGSPPGEAEAGAALNSLGRAYPKVLDIRTGEPIPYLGEGLTKIPVEARVPWGASERAAFIKEWYNRGFSTQEGGWSNYDIHHILPREYGGANSFDNLVPVERSVHQNEFDPWWRGY